MGNNGYVVSQIGMQLTGVIREAVGREFNMERNQIGMGIPGEDKNLAVCIYPYDIKRNRDIHHPEMVSVNAAQLRYPSSYYDLYYMLVPYSYSDMKYRMEEELRLLDVLLQVLGDLHYLKEIGEEKTKVEFDVHDIDFDGKTKIWAGINQPMHTAVYCKAGPVEIQSARMKQVKRVTEIQMDFTQVGGVK